MPVPGTGVGLARERVFGYDLARALAILGMVVVHFSLVLTDGKFETAGPLGHFVELLDGRAAATFVVLAGVGLTLLSRRALASGDAAALKGVCRTLTRRGAFLLAAGFLNLIVWPGDILRVYGVSIALAAWFVASSGRTLLAVSGAFVVGFVALFFALNYEARWNWATLSYRDLWTPTGVVANLSYDGFRSVFPWAGFLFFGMWLGRLPLDRPGVRGRWLAGGLGVMAVAEVASRGLVRLAQHRSGLDAETAVALFGTASMPPLPLFLMAAGGFSVATIAASLWAAERFAGNVVMRAFVATGQMAFTWYIAHIVIGLGAIVTLGLEGSRTLPVAVAAGAGFFALAAALSFWWRGAGRRGPLEWLMRRLAG